MFCNKSSKAFLERQMFKDKHIPLLAIEVYSFDATFCHLFTQSSFSAQYLLSTNIITTSK